MGAELTVDFLHRRIAGLVATRQTLREGGAGSLDLEQNRLWIVAAQQELCLALIALHAGVRAEQAA